VVDSSNLSTPTNLKKREARPENQKGKTGLAEDINDRSSFSLFASTFFAFPVPGGVAQLGEHVLCKHGVVGSNPITSTISARSDQRAVGASESSDRA
jgi:hypothetical protein